MSDAQRLSIAVLLLLLPASRLDVALPAAEVAMDLGPAVLRAVPPLPTLATVFGRPLGVRAGRERRRTRAGRLGDLHELRLLRLRVHRVDHDALDGRDVALVDELVAVHEPLPDGRVRQADQEHHDGHVVVELVRHGRDEVVVVQRALEAQAVLAHVVAGADVQRLEVLEEAEAVREDLGLEVHLELVPELLRSPAEVWGRNGRRGGGDEAACFLVAGVPLGHGLLQAVHGMLDRRRRVVSVHAIWMMLGGAVDARVEPGAVRAAQLAAHRGPEATPLEAVAHFSLPEKVVVGPFENRDGRRLWKMGQRHLDGTSA